MKLRDFIQQNNLDSVAQKYMSSSAVLYDQLGIDLLGFDISDGVVSTSVIPQAFTQGHEDIVHGGLVATYIDTVAGVHAMIQALIIGKAAYTKELHIAYYQPMIVGRTYQIVSVHQDQRFVVRIEEGDTVITRAELVFAFK